VSCKLFLCRLYQVFKKHEGLNMMYATQFFVCELLNLGNVVGNIFLVDRFLSGNFLRYGSLVLEVSPALTRSPLYSWLKVA
jgi:hypothetical protein